MKPHVTPALEAVVKRTGLTVAQFRVLARRRNAKVVLAAMKTSNAPPPAK